MSTNAHMTVYIPNKDQQPTLSMVVGTANKLIRRLITKVCDPTGVGLSCF
jgi:hypothetical protein